MPTDPAQTLDIVRTADERFRMMKLKGARSVVAIVLAVCAALLGGGGTAQAAPRSSAAATVVKGVYNGSGSLDVLVQAVFLPEDGLFGLPPYQTTKSEWGWNQAGGVYIRSGQCAQRWTSPSGDHGTWTRAGSDWRGGTLYRLAGNFWVKIVPYYC
jgi:hypothetical protein